MDKHYLTPAERHKLNCWLEAALPSIETQRISKAKAATMASGELGFRVTPGHLHSAAAALDLDAWPASREAKVDRVALLAETMLELWPGANNETRNLLAALVAGESDSLLIKLAQRLRDSRTVDVLKRRPAGDTWQLQA